MVVRDIGDYGWVEVGGEIEVLEGYEMGIWFEFVDNGVDMGYWGEYGG